MDQYRQLQRGHVVDYLANDPNAIAMLLNNVDIPAKSQQVYCRQSSPTTLNPTDPLYRQYYDRIYPDLKPITRDELAAIE